MPGRGLPNRKEPSGPQHQGIKREKDDETSVATKLTLDNKPDEIVGEAADDHEGDVIDNQYHGMLPFIRWRSTRFLHSAINRSAWPKCSSCVIAPSLPLPLVAPPHMLGSSS